MTLIPLNIDMTTLMIGMHRFCNAARVRNHLIPTKTSQLELYIRLYLVRWQ